MADTVKIAQFELVTAILSELERQFSEQGTTHFNRDSLGPIMNSAIGAANSIKRDVDALGIARGEDART